MAATSPAIGPDSVQQPSMMIQKPLLVLATTLAILISAASSGSAQTSFEDFEKGRLGSGLGDLTGSSPFASDEPVSLIAYYKLKPNSNIGLVYIEAIIQPGWHLYSRTQPAGGPMKSVMVLRDTEKYKLVGAWKPDEPPHVKFDEVFQVNVESFDDKVIWTAPIELANDVDPTKTDIAIRYTGQTCVDDGSCIPLSENLTASFVDEVETREIERGVIPAAAPDKTDAAVRRKIAAAELVETPEELAAMAELYEPGVAIKYEKLDGSSGRGTFWAALLGAFLGGMILNLMPCVFPVLGIKLLGFVEQAGSEPARIRKHGVAFAAGLVSSMWALAGAILVIKFALGKQINWGAQMGNSYFVGGIVILLFVLGLNLAGVFEMGMFMTRAGNTKKKTGYTGSFFSGIITTLVATPCSGPFLGTAMGYTLVQPPLIAMFLFTVFGLGLAFPYLILSFFPSYIRMLPRPGEWMETFKKFMAFTLFAAAAFFAKAFGSQTGIDGLGWFLLALCVIALACFFYGKWSSVMVAKTPRVIWGFVTPVIVAGLGVWMYLDAAGLEAPEVVARHDDGRVQWKLWVPGRVEANLALGKPVWVDYTADW